MLSYGLKLWSVNKDLFEDAVESVVSGVFDFIELYTIPDDFDPKSLQIFVDHKIKIAIHAPHGRHGFNPIDSDNDAYKIWVKIKKYIDFLDPFKIVIHPEYGKNVKVLEERLKRFNDQRILIENMPKKSPLFPNLVFYGYSIEQLDEIKKFNSQFCFDFAKAKSSAISQGLDVTKFIDTCIERIEPSYFHVSGFLDNTEADEHFDLWEGSEVMMKYMKNVLKGIGKGKELFVVFECKKMKGIENDIKNLEYFKSL